MRTFICMPTAPAARLGIGRWIDGYNARRPYQALADKTPDDVYFAAAQAIVEIAAGSAPLVTR